MTSPRDDNNLNTIYFYYAETITLFLMDNLFPISWYHSRQRSYSQTSTTNKVQERALCITYNNQLTDFKSLSSNHNEITIHQRNLQVLMTKYKKY